MRGICGSRGRDTLKKDFQTLRQERRIVESKVKLCIKILHTVRGPLFDPAVCDVFVSQIALASNLLLKVQIWCCTTYNVFLLDTQSHHIYSTFKKKKRKSLEKTKSKSFFFFFFSRKLLIQHFFTCLLKLILIHFYFSSIISPVLECT